MKLYLSESDRELSQLYEAIRNHGKPYKSGVTNAQRQQTVKGYYIEEVSSSSNPKDRGPKHFLFATAKALLPYLLRRLQRPPDSIGQIITRPRVYHTVSRPPKRASFSSNCPTCSRSKDVSNRSFSIFTGSQNSGSVEVTEAADNQKENVRKKLDNIQMEQN